MHAWLVDFHFIAAVKPTGIPDILTLVSSVSLYFSLYSKTNTTTSQPQPSQVRSELLCYCSCKSWRGVAIHQDASIALYSQYSIYAICIDAIYLCIDASIALYGKFPDLVVELPLWIIQASWRSLWINK